MQVPDDALKIEGLTAKLHAVNVPVIDDFQFFAPGGVAATVSYDITWTASGDVQHFRPQSSDPMDPANFSAEFRSALATISFTGTEPGFTVTGTANSDGIFAEMGTERNGFFLGGQP